MKNARAGLALTWDGARWPVGKLSARARAFLDRSRVLTQARMSEALSAGTIDEIRICWVPRLNGGEPALCKPFSTPNGRRISFRMKKTISFGEVLGVVYRRSAS